MKTLLHQTDERLSPWMRAGGCLFMSLLAIPQLESLHFLSPEEITALETFARGKGWLAQRPGKSGWYTEKPNEILAEAWKHCMAKGPAPVQIGGIDLLTGATWGKIGGGRYAILKGQGHSLSHFRLGNSAGRELYDPRPFTVIRKEERVDYYA
jgi:hypothetical protein